MRTPLLTLYFDGKCPFCRAGMERLARRDRHARLAFVDIAAAGFDPAVIGATMAELDRELHARRADGSVLKGTRSIVAAYAAVGQGWRVAWMRLPLAGALYLLFARHRYTMSRLLGFRPRDCADGVCSISSHLLR